MKDPLPHTQICVWQIDGSMRHFAQIEPEVLNHAIAGLHSGHLFSQDRITIVDEDSEVSFFPPRVTRMDFITDQAAVWDFPFSFGALMEVSEAEFVTGVSALAEPPDFRSDTEIFLDTETVSGQRTYLEMEIVAGFPAARMSQIFSLFQGRQLVFGLLARGVRVLNVSNVARFAIHPEPVPIKMKGHSENCRDKKSRLRPASHRTYYARSTSTSSFENNRGAY